MAGAGFTEVRVIEDDESTITIPITEKVDRQGILRYSFALMRKIKRDTGLERTHWLQRRHIAALRKLLDELDQVLAEVESARAPRAATR